MASCFDSFTPHCVKCDESYDRVPEKWECGNCSALCWQPDSDARVCTSCKAEFDIFKRRHHCRMCGYIFCNSCSMMKSSVTPVWSDEISCSELRVCSRCDVVGIRKWLRECKVNLVEDSYFQTVSELSVYVQQHLAKLNVAAKVVEYGLCEDEAFALVLYTVDCPKIYFEVGRLLREESAEAEATLSRFYMPFLSWFSRGFRKLPVYNGKLFRFLPTDKLSIIYAQTGPEMHLMSPTSCTTFLGPDLIGVLGGGGGRQTVLVMDVAGARDLSQLSVFTAASEYVLNPGWKGRLIGALSDADKTLISNRDDIGSFGLGNVDFRKINVIELSQITGVAMHKQPKTERFADRVAREFHREGDCREDASPPSSSSADCRWQDETSTEEGSSHNTREEDEAIVSGSNFPSFKLPANYAPPDEFLSDFANNAIPVLRDNGCALIEKISTDCVKIAGDRLARDTEKQLVLADAFAIAIYTYDLGRGCVNKDMSDNFYYVLNRALRKRIDVVLVALRPFMFHLKRALSCMPRMNVKCYRGLPASDIPLLSANYQNGQPVTWTAFTSVSLERDVCAKFAKKEGGRAGVVLEINVVDGRSINTFSAIPKEKELLLEPNATFLVCGEPTPGEDGNLVLVLQQQKSSATFVF